MRFLALGDSYTIGENVEPSERWPVQLAARLREQGIEIDDPIIVAVTGWTTDELSAGIDHAQPPGAFDLVSLLIGVNNQYRGRPIDEYRREFVALLQRAIAFAGRHPSRALVLSIPDWGVTPFAAGRDTVPLFKKWPRLNQRRRYRAAIAADIDRFNAVNREEAARLGARYVDVTPVSRRAASDPALLAADGLHPSGKMYAEWAQLALPVARAALEK
jgi:lysophospholipase L1-like esterase